MNYSVFSFFFFFYTLTNECYTQVEDRDGETMKKGKQSQNRTGLLFKKFVSVRCSSGGLLRAAVVAILFLMSVCSLTADVRASVMI